MLFRPILSRGFRAVFELVFSPRFQLSHESKTTRPKTSKNPPEDGLFSDRFFSSFSALVFSARHASAEQTCIFPLEVPTTQHCDRTQLSFPCRSTNAITDRARRPRVRRFSRPGWVKRQDHPRRRRSYAKRVTRSTPIHRAKTSSVTAVKVKVKSSLRQGPGGWEIVVRSQGQGSGAGYGRLCSYGLQCSHGHGGFRPVVQRPSSSSRQGCYVSWEGSARRERDPSAAHVLRVIGLDKTIEY